MLLQKILPTRLAQIIAKFEITIESGKALLPHYFCVQPLCVSI